MPSLIQRIKARISVVSVVLLTKVHPAGLLVISVSAILLFLKVMGTPPCNFLLEASVEVDGVAILGIVRPPIMDFSYQYPDRWLLPSLVFLFRMKKMKCSTKTKSTSRNTRTQSTTQIMIVGSDGLSICVILVLSALAVNVLVVESLECLQGSPSSLTSLSSSLTSFGLFLPHQRLSPFDNDSLVSPFYNVNFFVWSVQYCSLLVGVWQVLMFPFEFLFCLCHGHFILLVLLDVVFLEDRVGELGRMVECFRPVMFLKCVRLNLVRTQTPLEC